MATFSEECPQAHCFVEHTPVNCSIYPASIASADTHLAGLPQTEQTLTRSSFPTPSM